MLLVLAGCTPAQQDGGSGFVATIRPLQLMIEPITGEPVTVLLEPGASPHTYDPRPSDARSAVSAAVLFYGARDLDGWAADLGAPAAVDVLGLIPDSLLLEADGLYDPHFWMDPLTVLAVLPAVSDTLCHFDAAGCAEYRRRAGALAADLDVVHDSLAAMMKPAGGTAVLLSHPFLRYFARRYDVPIAGVVEEIPGSEPTIRDVRRMVEQARHTGARAIFTLPQHPTRLAAAVSDATGIPVVELDPIGGGSNGYADLLYFNAQKIRDAIADRPTLP